MNAILRSLVPAAAAAAALLAAPAARADHDVRRYPPPVLAPAPVYAPAPAPAYAPPPEIAYRPEEVRARVEWVQLQREYRSLERARDRFYASWRGNPWRQRRFETWYASRRAELDHRREWLTRREWNHGGERYAWGQRGHDGHDD
jgi:hypothetical protein